MNVFEIRKLTDVSKDGPSGIYQYIKVRPATLLLVAESDPGQKELMIRLIQHLTGEDA